MTAALVVVLVAGALAGCAPAPELSSSVAQGLQQSVQAVATNAAANDLAAATTELDALQSKLDAAVASNDVNSKRASTIQAAIDLVRADLQQKVADAAQAENDRIAAQAELDRIAQEKAADELEAAKAAEEKAAEDNKGPKGPGPNNDKGKKD